jgi:hypothetical protein
MKFYANRSRVGTAGTEVALSAATGAPDARNKKRYQHGQGIAVSSISETRQFLQH